MVSKEFVYIGEYSGKDCCYSELRQCIMLGELHGDEFTEEGFLSDSPESDNISDHIKHLVETAEKEGVEYELSQEAKRNFRLES